MSGWRAAASLAVFTSAGIYMRYKVHDTILGHVGHPHGRKFCSACSAHGPLQVGPRYPGDLL